MQTNTAAQFLPTIHDDKKLEVSIEADEVILKLSTWTENLGWLCQKTMRVEAGMIDDLHRIISAARYKLNQRNYEEKANLPVKIIAFPKAA